MKHYLSIFCIIVLLASCNNDKTTETTTEITSEKNTEFSAMLDLFYEEGLKLNPLNATSAGDNRYNNKLPNTLSPGFSTEEKSYYQGFKTKAESYKDIQLNSTQQLSRDILIWDCNINLERLNFREDLTPINQMWTKKLT